MTIKFKALREALVKAPMAHIEAITYSDTDHATCHIVECDNWEDALLAELAAKGAHKLLKALDDACDRLVDVCQRDDGQGYKEAERFLERMGRAVP